MGTFLILALGLILGAVTLALYGVVRASAAPSGDVLAGVRVHGFVTALAALLFSTVTGLDHLLTRTRSTTAGVPDEHAGGWLTAPAELDPGWAGWALALAGPVMVALIHAGAQLTFPAPRGDVRRASLVPRSAGRLLPVGLTALAGLLTALIVAASALLAREPSSPAVIPPEGHGGDATRLPLFPAAVAAGAELTPWIALAVAAVAACLAVGLAAISRRRALEGLTAAQDRAARTVAANRLFRTGVWMLWLILGDVWTAFTVSREARDVLAEHVPEHPAALSVDAAIGWISAVDAAGTVATLVLILVLLLWRSPALRALRPHRAAPAAPHTAPAAGPRP